MKSYSFHLLEKQIHANFDFDLAHSHPIFKCTRKTREVALCRSFERNFVSTMGFQTNIPQGLTLADLTTPVESDSESVISTIPTKSQLKPSKIDVVRPFQDNTGFHLVSSSNNTQPKISFNTHAPPHPSRYSHVVIPRDPLGQYYQEGHNQPAIKIQETNNTVNKPVQIPNENDTNNDNSEENDNSVWSFDDMDEVETVPAQRLATNATRTLGDYNTDK